MHKQAGGEEGKAMIYMGPCYRNNLCVDCDSEICGHAGDITADCPAWKCLHPDKECKDCDFLRDYVEAWRREHDEKERKDE